MFCSGVSEVLRTRVCGTGVPVPSGGGVSLFPHAEGRHRQAAQVAHRQKDECHRSVWRFCLGIMIMVIRRLWRFCFRIMITVIRRLWCFCLRIRITVIRRLWCFCLGVMVMVIRRLRHFCLGIMIMVIRRLQAYNQLFSCL